MIIYYRNNINILYYFVVIPHRTAGEGGGSSVTISPLGYSSRQSSENNDVSYNYYYLLLSTWTKTCSVRCMYTHTYFEYCARIEGVCASKDMSIYIGIRRADDSCTYEMSTRILFPLSLSLGGGGYIGILEDPRGERKHAAVQKVILNRVT